MNLSFEFPKNNFLYSYYFSNFSKSILGSDDKCIRIWTRQTCLKTLRGHEGAVTTLSMEGMYIKKLSRITNDFTEKNIFFLI